MNFGTRPNMIWVAVKALILHYNTKDTYQMVGFISFGSYLDFQVSAVEQPQKNQPGFGGAQGLDVH